MSIVKEIVDLHGGTVTPHSTKDKGTVIRICLPRAAGRQEPVAAVGGVA